MKNKFENNTFIAYLEGHIDTNNAEQVGEEVNTLLAEHPGSFLCLDCENLTYISSAGLRQILKLRKKTELSIINCPPEIFEIFEMTGFSEMMDIRKGYRKMSVEGCEKIGEGSNGIVYRLNPDTIIKVYKNSDALDDIKKERELAKKALVMGINTAISFDVVKVGDKYGSVFELLNSKSITKLIKDNPENKDEYIKIFADLLKEIHGTVVKDNLLPSAKEKALEWARWLEKYLPAPTYNKLVKIIDEIPECNNIVHGDYHTSNVHYANGEAILIDMDTLSVGNPIFEFASIYLAYIGYGEIDHSNVENFLKLDWATTNYIFNKLVDDYFAGQPKETVESTILKAKAIAYTRSLRRTIKREPEKKDLIEHYKKQLIETIDKI